MHAKDVPTIQRLTGVGSSWGATGGVLIVMVQLLASPEVAWLLLLAPLQLPMPTANQNPLVFTCRPGTFPHHKPSPTPRPSPHVVVVVLSSQQCGGTTRMSCS